MKKIKNVPIIRHDKMSSDTYKLVIKDEELASITAPGQFAQLKTSASMTPLLRRPISVADVDKEKGTVTFIYRLVGTGTKCLSAIGIGCSLDIVAPLGRGFSLGSKKPLLVGGGVGIAPLIYLARALCGASTQVLLAGRNESELFWQREFGETCKQIHITTDDGSLGVRGNALALLPKLLEQGGFDFIYTCGPAPMMHGVAELATKYNIPCEVSLEKYMACGIGACLTCSCTDRNGTRVKVCTDGPVFLAEEVVEW